MPVMYCFLSHFSGARFFLNKRCLGHSLGDSRSVPEGNASRRS